MKKIAELRAKLAGLKKQAMDMLDTAEAKGGFDEAQQAAFDAKKAEITATTGEISAAEALQEERRAMGAIDAPAQFQNRPPPAASRILRSLPQSFAARPVRAEAFVMTA